MTDAQIDHPLPWHEPAWKQLKQARASGRFPHAILLVGPRGTGKRLFSERVAKLLLCESPNWDAIQPCDKCQHCKSLEHGAHPDYRKISPAEGKREISIDDIRNTNKYIQLSSQSNLSYKIAVIEPADALNRSSANALLKTLEEPPAGRVLILIAELLGKIPVTIRSRCRIIRFSQATDAVAMHWLAHKQDISDQATPLIAAGYTPLQALEMLQDEAGEGAKGYLSRIDMFRKQLKAVLTGGESPLDVALKWSDAESEFNVTKWLQKELTDAFRDLNGIKNAEGQAPVFTDAGLGINEILEISNNISRLQSNLGGNLNARLEWENFLLNCHRMKLASPARLS